MEQSPGCRAGSSRARERRRGGGTGRRLDALGRRRGQHTVRAVRPDQRGELREPGGRLAVARRQLRADPGQRHAVDADLRRGQALRRGRLPAHRRRHGPGDRRDPVDLPRAAHETVGGLDAEELRQGRRLRRRERRGAHLCRHARVLPPRARPGHRRSDRWLRQRRHRGPAGRLRLRVPPDRRVAVHRRLHHELVAADRRQRRGRGRQLARAGGTGRHGTRTSPVTSWPTTRPAASTSGSSTSSRSPRANSASTRGRTTPGSGPATSRRGRRCPPTRSAGSSTW